MKIAKAVRSLDLQCDGERLSTRLSKYTALNTSGVHTVISKANPKLVLEKSTRSEFLLVRRTTTHNTTIERAFVKTVQNTERSFLSHQGKRLLIVILHCLLSSFLQNALLTMLSRQHHPSFVRIRKQNNLKDTVFHIEAAVSSCSNRFSNQPDTHVLKR